MSYITFEDKPIILGPCVKRLCKGLVDNLLPYDIIINISVSYLEILQYPVLASLQTNLWLSDFSWKSAWLSVDSKLSQQMKHTHTHTHTAKWEFGVTSIQLINFLIKINTGKITNNVHYIIWSIQNSFKNIFEMSK